MTRKLDGMTERRPVRPVSHAHAGFRGAVLLLALLGGVANAAEPAYVDVWGPALGSTLPILDAPDQSGTPRTLEDLSGRQGLLLFLNRSADW